MLNLNSVMLGSKDPAKLAAFYEKIFGKSADMHDGDWYGWQVGACFLSIGGHSEVGDRSKEPARIIINLETEDVEAEFAKIKELGAEVIQEPYSMEDGDDSKIATFADPDGNYIQLMSPWEAPAE